MLSYFPYHRLCHASSLIHRECYLIDGKCVFGGEGGGEQLPLRPQGRSRHSNKVSRRPHEQVPSPALMQIRQTTLLQSGNLPLSLREKAKVRALEQLKVARGNSPLLPTLTQILRLRRCRDPTLRVSMSMSVIALPQLIQ